ncbi:MAG: LytTR family DNA-binding domain-containing protein [Taibaiella sp.]|nr:LytTR family DNA-binding domain-containing protein [Taibaiella sp.]
MMNCLIVDDEPVSREIIQNYCTQLPYLSVTGSCDNALEAKIVLQKQRVDILFLDINMPVMDGISFLKTLKHPPQVIFTTAYKEYALDAFDLAATDYLLKPFSLDRFIIAVDKALEKITDAKVAAVAESVQTEEYCFIKTDGKIYKLQFEDVLYAEASGNYTKIVTTQNTLVPAMTFTAVEELLSAPAFIRVHRSFIINKSKISHIEGNRVYINGTEIPVGSNYKEEFLKTLGFQ